MKHRALTALTSIAVLSGLALADVSIKFDPDQNISSRTLVSVGSITHELEEDCEWFGCSEDGFETTVTRLKALGVTGSVTADGVTKTF